MIGSKLAVVVIGIIVAVSAVSAVSIAVVSSNPGNDSGSDNGSSNEVSVFNITYVLNGGTNSSQNPLTYTSGKEIALSDPTYTGHTFKGWYTDSVFSNKVTSISASSTGDMTLYAKWDVNTYGISYVLNGGTNSTQNPSQYTYGTEVVLSDPVYTEHTFNGWFTESTFVNRVTSVSASAVGDVTLYAKWDVNTYGISYVLNGGINSTSNPSQYTYGTEAVLSDPTYTGHTFKGWYSESTFVNKVTSISTSSTGDVTLYAKWDVNTYSITYVLDGGTNSVNNPTQYTYGDEITFEDAEYDGYLFAGWYLDENGENMITAISADTVGDLTLYAGWQYSLVGKEFTYNFSGKTEALSFYSQKTIISGTVTYRYMTYSLEKGYYVQYTQSYTATTYWGNMPYGSREYTDTETYWSGESSDYTWTNKGTETVTVPYGASDCIMWEGKDSSNTKTQIQYQGINDGYTYKMTYTERSRSSTTSLEYTLASVRDIEIKDDYEVRVYGDDGISVSGAGVKDAYSEVTVTAAVSEGYTFGGWYDESDNLLSSDLTYTIDTLISDVVLYAKNTLDTDRVFDSNDVTVTAYQTLHDVTWTFTDSTEQTVTSDTLTYSFSEPGVYDLMYVGKDASDRTVYGFFTVFIDGTSTKTYTWTYNGTNYSTTLDIKYSDFLVYRNDDISRSQGSTEHDLELVTYTDPYIVTLSGKLMALASGWSDLEKVNFILAFTQYIEYQYDSDSMGVEEYWKYPLETLYDQNGDCEDTSILFCAIAKASGYDCCMLLFYGHMAAGVSVTGATGAEFPSGSVTYYYCETTASGYSVGDLPRDSRGNELTEYSYKGLYFESITPIV